MALSGVRSSCEMVARNSSFMRLASSASARAVFVARLRVLLVVDVGGGGDPADDGAAQAALGHGAPEVPAIGAVGGAAQAILDDERLAGAHRRGPRLDDALAIVRDG